MIDPLEITTVRVGQLPNEPFGLTDKIPHEIGSDLKQGTVQGLADTIGAYLGTTDSLAFNPTTVTDGQTLPATTSNEWMLVGKGTFYNVNGGATIVTTEELNALTSNSLYWSLSVEIPIDVELAGIVQTIRSGFTTTTPSEDAVFNALALKANSSEMHYPVSIIDYPLLVIATSNFTIPVDRTAIMLYSNQAPNYPLSSNNTTKNYTFTQSGTTVTTKNPIPIGALVTILLQ